MDRIEILEKSRKENKNKDLYQVEIEAKAGNIASRVGALICTLVSILAYALSQVFLYSPWIIYFGILGTNYAYRYKCKKEKTDLYICLLYFGMGILCFIFFVLRFLERL